MLLCLHLQATKNKENKKKMKEIIIVGASGFGREVLQWIKDINSVSLHWVIKGFLDDNLNALEGYKCDYQILGTIKEWQPGKEEVFTCAVAIPRIKELLVNTLLQKGAVFTNVVHPTSILSEFCEIGEGLLITPRAKISPNVKIGNYVTILGSGVGHDAIIDDFSTISGGCSINGHVQIGKGVFVASNSCIAPSKKIGNNAFIGMGSMVVSNVKDGYKVMGNPAKKMEF